MTQIFCTRKIEFDAAHRILNHENKCKMLHGHRYGLEARFKSKTNKLDSLGRVIDFSIIQKILGQWIEQNFDHNLILDKRDQKLGEEIAAITGQKIFYLTQNPTAENIALFLLNEICPQIFSKEAVECASIKLYETPNCYVEVFQ